MKLPCINCVYCETRKGLFHYCFLDPTKGKISIEELFEVYECEYAVARSYKKINCLNCNDTGYSGGQPCNCRD